MEEQPVGQEPPATASTSRLLPWLAWAATTLIAVSSLVMKRGDDALRLRLAMAESKVELLSTLNKNQELNQRLMEENTRLASENNRLQKKIDHSEGRLDEVLAELRTVPEGTRDAAAVAATLVAIVCPDCDGSRTVSRAYGPSSDSAVSVEEGCETCTPEGYVVVPFAVALNVSECPTCRGSGLRRPGPCAQLESCFRCSGSRVARYVF